MKPAENTEATPLQIAEGPVIEGVGVVFTIIGNTDVLLQLPLLVVNETDPAGPAPQITVTVDAFAAPLIVPPVTVQLYIEADGAEYVFVAPLHTLDEPVIADVGVLVTVTFKTVLVVEQPVDEIVSFTETELRPAVFQSTVIELEPCPDTMVPPEVTFHR